MQISSNTQLKIKHMQLIAAIADYQQLGLAAQAVAISQPAASRMLAEIEKLIGADICIRHPKGLQLTEIGEVLARRAHNMMIEMADLMDEVAHIKSGRTGTASVGAVTGAALGYIVPAIQQLRATSPAAEITVNVGPSAALIQDLVKGQLDFAMARIPPDTEMRDFDCHEAQTETVSLLVRQGHPLIGKPKLTLAELAEHEWVLEPAGAPIRQAIGGAFAAEQVGFPQNITSTTSLLAMLALMSSTDAIAAVANQLAELLLGPQINASICKLELGEPITVSPYFLLTMKHRQLSPLADRLRELVMRELQELKSTDNRP